MPGSILLVDDDPDVLATLRALLEFKGYTVHTANNADQAKAIITENKIYIVIMDLIIPDLFGDQAINALKKIDEKLHIIFLSGHEIVFEAVKDFEFDVHRIFLKPVDPEVLLSTIKIIYEEQAEPCQLVDA